MHRPGALRYWPVPRLEIGRAVARVLCGVLAILGGLPLLLAMTLTAGPVRHFAEARTTSLIHRAVGVDASYRLSLRLIPLRLGLSDVKLLASHGRAPPLPA